MNTHWAYDFGKNETYLKRDKIGVLKEYIDGFVTDYYWDEFFMIFKRRQVDDIIRGIMRSCDYYFNCNDLRCNYVKRIRYLKTWTNTKIYKTTIKESLQDKLCGDAIVKIISFIDFVRDY